MGCESNVTYSMLQTLSPVFDTIIMAPTDAVTDTHKRFRDFGHHDEQTMGNVGARNRVAASDAADRHLSQSKTIGEAAERILGGAARVRVEDATKLLVGLDRNGDGFLDREEVMRAVNMMFASESEPEAVDDALATAEHVLRSVAKTTAACQLDPVLLLQLAAAEAAKGVQEGKMLHKSKGMDRQAAFNAAMVARGAATERAALAKLPPPCAEAFVEASLAHEKLDSTPPEMCESGRRRCDAKTIYSTLRADPDDAPARLLKWSWLKSQADLARQRQQAGRDVRDVALKRRQELPEEAFISAAEVEANAPAGWRKERRIAVFAVSYCWKSRLHPDPECETLIALATAFETCLSKAANVQKQLDPWEGFPTEFGVFIDVSTAGHALRARLPIVICCTCKRRPIA